MSSAGQANEAGSVARRNAATYFGVYMLASRPIEALGNHRAIAHIAFESRDPTDDIILTFNGGGRAFVSSKRRVTLGKPFTESVAGWVSQLDEDLGDEDLLVLTCEESAQWVADLAEALAKLRAGAEVASQRLRGALAKLDNLVPIEKRDEVHRRARIIQLPRSVMNDDGRTVLMVIMSELVEDNAGSAAVSAISGVMHDLAGGALAIDAAALVAAIAARDVAVLADENGPVAARAAAAEAHVASYLSCLGSMKGRIDLTLLADDLQPIEVPDLLQNVYASVTYPEADRTSDEQLISVLRRNRRLLMVGKPGSGKSQAIRELAACCATDPNAPTPVPVNLPVLLARLSAQTVRVEDLVSLAAERGPRSGKRHVEQYLATAIERGDAILLLDGLDECRDKAAWVANQIKMLVDGLPESTGVVVATRASAETQASNFGFPRVNLIRPSDLNATMDAVLVQCADKRIADHETRSNWLRSRRDWLVEAHAHQSGLLELPQLALLITLIIGSKKDLDVPERRAKLLHEAVKVTVERWEYHRFAGGLNGTWAKDLTPNILLDGFVVLGRLLDNEAISHTAAEATAALTELLTEPARWDLARARAEELAVQILVFWDTHAAVFVLDEEGRLTSRSRVFTETATAMWTTRCSEDELLEWATDAIRYHDSEGVVALALGLNTRLVERLLELGESNPEATMSVATGLLSNAFEATCGQLEVLARQLGRHAIDIESGRREPPKRQTRKDDVISRLLASRPHGWPASWQLIEALCSLRLGDAERMQRDESLRGLGLDAVQGDIVTAMAALVDAQADRRQLEPGEVALVGSVLVRDLPRSHHVDEIKGLRGVVRQAPLAPGLGFVAHRAVAFLDQLPEVDAERIYRISERMAVGLGESVQAELRRRGVESAISERESRITELLSSFSDTDYEMRLLRDIESLGDTTVVLSKYDRWSMPSLGDLIEATGYPYVYLGDIKAAFLRDDCALRQRWLRALSASYGVDLNKAAAEAALVLAGSADISSTPAGWRIVSRRRFHRRELADPLALSATDQETLVDCMYASSHWLAWSAMYVLVHAEPKWDTLEFFKADRSNWPPYRASECYFLGLLKNPEGPQLAVRAAVSTDPSQRRALQEAIQYRPALDPTAELSAALAKDEDLWVRCEDAGESGVTHWTCRWCGQRNVPIDSSCAKCELASRPGSIGSAGAR